MDSTGKDTKKAVDIRRELHKKNRKRNSCSDKRSVLLVHLVFSHM